MKNIKKIELLMIVLILFTACTKQMEKDSIKESPKKDQKEEVMIQKVSKNDVQFNEVETFPYLIKPQFDQYTPFVEGVMMVSKKTEQGEKYGFINNVGEVIVDPVYDDTKSYISMSDACSGFSEMLAPVKKGEKWGYIDINGKETISFSYEDADLFSDGMACVKISGKWGYINKHGKTVISPNFDWGSEFCEGIAVVKDNEKYGFIDQWGRWLVDPIYDGIELGRYSYYWKQNKIIQIYQNDLSGFAKIDNGTVDIMVNPKYNKIYPFRENQTETFFVQFKKDEEGCYTDPSYGYVDRNGKEILRWEAGNERDYSLLSEGIRAHKNENEQWGYINKNGDVVIPYQYDQAADFHNNCAVVSVAGKDGVIDKKGNWILEPNYTIKTDGMFVGLKENYFMIEENNQKKLIPKDNVQTQSEGYDDIGYGKTFIPVTKGKKMGFIDHTLKPIISCQYDAYRAVDCKNYFACVQKDGQWYFIDEKGEQVQVLCFEEVSDFRYHYASVKKDGKWGAINDTGELIIPCIFDSITIVEKGVARIEVEEKFGFVQLPQIINESNVDLDRD